MLKKPHNKITNVFPEIFLPDVLTDFERYLGDIKNSQCSFSYAAVVASDELERFPKQACEELNGWGLHQYYVPCEYGGKLGSFDTLFWLLRLLSRRDLTIAIGHGKTYLGALPVYVGGNSKQKHYISHSILAGKVVSLGLTEKNHGADLVANELIANRLNGNYVLSGEKWLINNATRGDFVIVFAKTSSDISSRNHSLLIVDKEKLDKSSVIYLPKIKTHGIRGADISGIKYTNATLGIENLIYKEGTGLEIILKSLQISRTLCASLSIGAADTALRTTLQFCQYRKLYNHETIHIPYIKNLLIDSYINILICEILSSSIIRCLHFYPQLMSFYSSIIKYFVPHVVENLFDTLSSILGSRYFLREELNEGIFQKFYRDNSIIGLFDGSSIINLQSISNQINQIAQKSLSNNFIVPNPLFKDIFTLHIELPSFEMDKLKLSNHGMDFITQSLEWFIGQLNVALKNQREPYVMRLIYLANKFLSIKNKLLKKIDKKDFFHEKLDKNKEAILKEYCALFSALCCFYTWFFNCNKYCEEESIWLQLCLSNILKHINYKPYSTSSFTIYRNNIFLKMYEQFNQNKLFSLFNFNL